MSRPLWWRRMGDNTAHGPCASIAEIARAATRGVPVAEIGDGILVGTAPRPHWNTAIFARVDEMFDAANPMPDLGDYPPSCAWTPAQLGELCAELEGVLTAWLGRHGHSHTRAPDAAEINWYIAFTRTEIMRLAGAIEPAAEQPEYRGGWAGSIPVSWS